VGVRITTEECVRRCVEIHGNKYNYSKVNYISSKIAIEIICKQHGSFFLFVSNFHIFSSGGRKINYLYFLS
jgi:hypothetical protein